MKHKTMLKKKLAEVSYELIAQRDCGLHICCSHCSISVLPLLRVLSSIQCSSFSHKSAASTLLNDVCPPFLHSAQHVVLETLPHCSTYVGGGVTLYCQMDAKDPASTETPQETLREFLCSFAGNADSSQNALKRERTSEEPAEAEQASAKRQKA